MVSQTITYSDGTTTTINYQKNADAAQIEETVKEEQESHSEAPIEAPVEETPVVDAPVATE